MILSTFHVFLHLGFSSLARQCAQLWMKTREMLGFPLGFISEPDHFVLPKGILEAACVKVSLHVGQFRQPILCEILMFVWGNFFPLEIMFPSFFIVLSIFYFILLE